jgi:hypothetical protein
MIVSARVVNTHSCRSCRSSSYGKAKRTPTLLPIQLACMVLTRSGQPGKLSRPLSSSSAYWVMRKKYIGMSRFSTSAPERQPRPSMTCSLASTVWSTGSQLTVAIFL